MKRLLLSETEYVITAFAERCSGPGWSNALITAVIEDSANGKVRCAHFQPKDQSDAMRHIFDFSALCHSLMTAAVEAVSTKQKPKRK